MTDKPEFWADEDQDDCEVFSEEFQDWAVCAMILESGRPEDPTRKALYDDALIDYLDHLSGLGQYQEMIDAYFRFGHGTEVDDDILRLVASALIALTRYSDAIDLLHGCKKPSSFGYDLLGQAYTSLGKQAEAADAHQKSQSFSIEEDAHMIEIYQQMVEDFPKDEMARRVLINSLERAGDIAGAIREIRKMIELMPDDKELRRRKAELENRLKLKKSQ